MAKMEKFDPTEVIMDHLPRRTGAECVLLSPALALFHIIQQLSTTTGYSGRDHSELPYL